MRKMRRILRRLDWELFFCRSFGVRFETCPLRLVVLHIIARRRKPLKTGVSLCATLSPCSSLRGISYSCCAAIPNKRQVIHQRRTEPAFRLPMPGVSGQAKITSLSFPIFPAPRRYPDRERHWEGRCRSTQTGGSDGA